MSEYTKHDRAVRIHEIFGLAIELPPMQRSAFIHTACGDDDGLRAEIESLSTHDA